MQPLYPNPQDFVGANLRRAYRGTPPNTLPDELEDLLARLAAKLDEDGRTAGQMRHPARRQRAMAGQGR